MKVETCHMAEHCRERYDVAPLESWLQQKEETRQWINARKRLLAGKQVILGRCTSANHVTYIWGVWLLTATDHNGPQRTTTI